MPNSFLDPDWPNLSYLLGLWRHIRSKMAKSRGAPESFRKRTIRPSFPESFSLLWKCARDHSFLELSTPTTKLDTVDYQLELINYIEWCLDDVTSQYFLANVIISLFQLVSTITPVFIIGPWWNVVGLLVDGQWRTHQWRHWVLGYARDLVHECNILFQIQQLHVASFLISIEPYWIS